MVHCVRSWSFRTYCGLPLRTTSNLTHTWAETTCKRCLAALRRHRGYVREVAHVKREGER